MLPKEFNRLAGVDFKRAIERTISYPIFPFPSLCGVRNRHACG